MLEVGAGIGGTASTLCDGAQEEWVWLEPDRVLAGVLSSKIKEGNLPRCCSGIQGVISDLAPRLKFDAILYVDVLAHDRS